MFVQAFRKDTEGDEEEEEEAKQFFVVVVVDNVFLGSSSEGEIVDWVWLSNRQVSLDSRWQGKKDSIFFPLRLFPNWAKANEDIEKKPIRERKTQNKINTYRKKWAIGDPLTFSSSISLSFFRPRRQQIKGNPT